MRLLVLSALLTLLTFDSAVAESHTVRLIGVSLTDDGSVSGESTSASVDVVQSSDCDEDVTTNDPEPFHDTIINISISNTLLSTFTAKKFYYRINTGSRNFRSRKLALLNSPVVAKDATTELQGLFLHALDGVKYFTSQDSPISSSLGFRNFTVYVEGVDGRGKRHTLQMRSVASFGDYDRCAN